MSFEISASASQAERSSVETVLRQIARVCLHAQGFPDTPLATVLSRMLVDILQVLAADEVVLGVVENQKDCTLYHLARQRPLSQQPFSRRSELDSSLAAYCAAASPAQIVQVPLGDRGAMGRLLALFAAPALRSIEQSMLEILATTLALVITQASLLREVQQQQSEQVFFETLVAAPSRWEEVQRMGLLLGTNLEHPHAAVVVEMEIVGKSLTRDEVTRAHADALALLAQQIKQAYPRTLMQIDQGIITFLIDLQMTERASTLIALQSELRRAAEQATTQFHARVWAGIGSETRPGDEQEGYVQSLQQAQETAKNGRRLYARQGCVFTHADLGVLNFVNPGFASSPNKYQLTIGKIAALERDPHLLATLDAYLSFPGRVTLIMRELNASRDTVDKRIARLKEVCREQGVDLELKEDIDAMHFCWYLSKAQSALPPRD